MKEFGLEARSWPPWIRHCYGYFSMHAYVNGFKKLSYVEKVTGFAGESSRIGSKRGCEGPALVTVTHAPITPPAADPRKSCSPTPLAVTLK